MGAIHTTDAGKRFELINELDLKRVPMLADEAVLSAFFSG